MTRIVRGLSVFCESFSKCTFSFSYVLFLTSFAFYHVNQFVDLQVICCLISRTSPVLLTAIVYHLNSNLGAVIFLVLSTGPEED